MSPTACFRAAPAAWVALMVALSACGGGGDSGGTTAVAADTPAPTPPPAASTSPAPAASAPTAATSEITADGGSLMARQYYGVGGLQGATFLQLVSGPREVARVLSRTAGITDGRVSIGAIAQMVGTATRTFACSAGSVTVSVLDQGRAGTFDGGDGVRMQLNACRIGTAQAVVMSGPVDLRTTAALDANRGTYSFANLTMTVAGIPWTKTMDGNLLVTVDADANGTTYRMETAGTPVSITLTQGDKSVETVWQTATHTVVAPVTPQTLLMTVQGPAIRTRTGFAAETITLQSLQPFDVQSADTAPCSGAGRATISSSTGASATVSASAATPRLSVVAQPSGKATALDCIQALVLME